MMGQSDKEMEGKGVNGKRFGDGGSICNLERERARVVHENETLLIKA